MRLFLFASSGVLLLSAACSSSTDQIGGNCGFPGAPAVTLNLQAAQDPVCPTAIPASVLSDCAPEAESVACDYTVNCNSKDANGNGYSFTATLSQVGQTAVWTGPLDVLYAPQAGAVDAQNCKYDETLR